MFVRRLGWTQQAGRCPGGHGCPEILEMASGDFAVIGTDITTEAVRFLPEGAGCAPGERVVQIPRLVLVLARRDIPASV